MELTLDQAREFYKFLQGGDAPKGIHLTSVPQLTSEQAFSVLYVLQEGYHLIDDRYERCEICGWLFDMDNAGGSLDAEELAGNGWQLLDPADDEKIVCEDCFINRTTPAEDDDEDAGYISGEGAPR